MTNLNSESMRGNSDRRKNPRIAFNVPVSVMGINQKATAVDFSLNGVFVQISDAGELKEGNLVRLAMRFPHEKTITIIKAKVVRTEEDGFGCEFIGLSPHVFDQLEKNFDFFKSMLPID